MAMAEEMMPKTLPGGGLASFLTSNIDEIDDSVLAFGRPAGINSMRSVAERMAQMGRNGDNFVVHASEREMMVPREVVEKNPELREQIMRSIAAEGADPRAYVVGSEQNSINPFTGQREFFLKKLVSGIKNVVKKVAPIVLPVVGSFILGPVWGAAAGSALNAAIQGGNARDVLKAGLIGGAAGGVFAGVSGAFQGVQAGIGALPGARAALGAAISPANAFGGLGSRIAERGILNAYQGPDFASLAAQAGAGAPSAAAAVPGPVQGPPPPPGTAPTVPVTAPPAPTAPQTFGQRVMDFVMPQRAATPADLAGQVQSLMASNPGITESTALSLVQNAQPSSLSRFIRPAVLAGGALALTGAFNPVEPQNPETPGYDTSSTDLLAANPGQYRVGVAPEPRYVTRQDVAISPYAMPVAPLQFAAQGGEMESFPRRMGAISGPGTETSDDVPAMLSDGEFVMTARAVRGAGNGDRQQGVRRMYDMMRMFEGGVAR